MCGPQSQVESQEDSLEEQLIGNPAIANHQPSPFLK
jgi:hypothetical protein